MPKLVIGGKDSSEYTDDELYQMLAQLRGVRVEEVKLQARERKPRTAKEIRKHNPTPLVDL